MFNSKFLGWFAFMIQRKQSLWLGLIFFICISAVMINIPFFDIDGKTDGKVLEDIVASVGFSHTSITIAKVREHSESNSLLKYCTLLTGLLALVSAFLYKQRQRQLMLGNIIYLLTAAMVVFMYYYGWSKRYVDLQPDTQIIISIIFPLIIGWANFKAISGIKNDEKLVKSYDRIR